MTLPAQKRAPENEVSLRYKHATDRNSLLRHRARHIKPPMPTKRRFAAGFTMMELLIVLAIVAIITVTGITSYVTAVGNQRLTIASEQLIDTLHQARSYSREAKDTHAWGVENLDKWTYRLVFLDGNGTKHTETEEKLLTGISFSGFFSIWYEKGSGDLDTQQEIHLTNAHGKVTTLMISKTGLVTLVR